MWNSKKKKKKKQGQIHRHRVEKQLPGLEIGENRERLVGESVQPWSWLVKP